MKKAKFIKKLKQAENSKSIKKIVISLDSNGCLNTVFSLKLIK